MRRQCKAANVENVEMLTRRSATTIKISGEPKRTPKNKLKQQQPAREKTEQERDRERERSHIDLEKLTFALQLQQK